MQRDDFEVRSFPGIGAVGVSEKSRPLRVAIVTEEIIGPVRNGGIASTYYHLARGLAAHGHEVHVLFLKGPVVQDETPEYWVQHYADFGVRLHYLEMPTAPLWGAAPTWQRRYASAYEWLRDQEPFDVVHTSEWRGGMVYALMAKRLGLQFRETLFLVKTSSPYIWNRHYQMQPIAQTDLLAASYAEQKCVELADLVIGGSAHLISFMDRIGYRLPGANVFVQPNIVDFSNLVVVDERPGPPRRHGDVVTSRDLVFFGRLEARKGIEIFCNAVDLLHERGEVPDTVTFLGKWSGTLPAQGGLTPENYVKEKAQTWDCSVTTVTDLNQQEALSFLCSRDLVAVMPSLIENSSMAVYEALEQRVPFIATAVGGTPELIAKEDHAASLIEPTAEALANRLEDVIRNGQVIARPRFSNEENLQVWYGFHAYVGARIEQVGRARAIQELTEGVHGAGAVVDTVSHVALVRRGETLDDLVKALHVEAPDHVVLGYTDASVRAEIERLDASLGELPCPVVVVGCLGHTTGEAFNLLVEAQPSDAMVVSDGVGAVPCTGYYAAIREGLTNRPECLLTTFFIADDLTEGMPLGGDVASQVATSRAYGPEVVALRTDTFAEIGGFEPYDARRGIVHEYVTRGAETGHDLLVLPERLLTWPAALEEVKDFSADPLYAYLKAKPVIDDSGLAQRKVMLAALRGSGGVTGLDERLLRGPGAEEAQSTWLLPARWDPEAVDGTHHRRLLVGLDSADDELLLYARGRGERRLHVRGEEQPIDLIISHAEESDDEHVTLWRFPVPGSWEQGQSYPLIWGLYDGEQKLRNLFLRINKIGAATFALAGRNPVLSAEALTAVVERRTLSFPGVSLREDEGAAWSSSAEPALGPPEEADEVGADDPTDAYVDQAVLAAHRFVRRRGDIDPVRAVMSSRELLAGPPERLPLPINPRSGLKPPAARDGWIEGDWLRGWAWDREDRERVVHVAVMADEPLFMTAADGVDPSLDEVPGRDLHAFAIPVLPEFLSVERLQLMIWEGEEPVYRGQLQVDREGEPMLRRLRPTPVEPPAEVQTPAAERWRRWLRWMR